VYIPFFVPVLVPVLVRPRPPGPRGAAQHGAQAALSAGGAQRGRRNQVAVLREAQGAVRARRALAEAKAKVE
jgi:hypothetical protein